MDLFTLYQDLNTKPHCILPHYATSLKEKLEKYLAGDLEMPVFDDKDEDDMPMMDGVAIISINGIICKRLGLPQIILDFFGLVDLDNVDAALKLAMEDETIKSVIIDVTSPGGFLSGVFSTANLVNELSKKKECVVFSDILNASAAYLISSQANTIITTADAEVGSIGVYTSVISYSKALESAGITATLIKAGRWKALGDPTQPLTDEQKAYMQDEVNKTWEQFKKYVNMKRDVDEDTMQGQTLSGQEALDAGLVDGLASDINEIKAILLEKE